MQLLFRLEYIKCIYVDNNNNDGDDNEMIWAQTISGAHAKSGEIQYLINYAQHPQFSQ